MPITFDKLLGKPLLHTHPVSDIIGLSVSGSSDTVVSVSTDQTLDNTSANVILVDASSTTSTLNITLPQASIVANKVFKIKKIDSSSKTITIIPFTGDQIENLSENLIIEFIDSSVQLISYSNGWFII
jgi:hypothetical protein